MTLADIPRVIEIEKLAYSSPWPPSAYRKEIQDNRYAHYIVVRDMQLAAPRTVPDHPEQHRRSFPLSLLPSRATPSLSPELSSIIAFAGLWLMIDESHITTIAVHPDFRGRGVGELMLSSLISISRDIGARMVTLEVRVSNTVAQNLYHKYGFKEAGIRRRYYSDNHEDALIMWTDEINGPLYRQHFDQLTAALHARLSAQDPSPSAAARQSAAGDA
jgi:ribosomal-protein-alanine N-acetyltransferase